MEISYEEQYNMKLSFHSAGMTQPFGREASLPINNTHPLPFFRQNKKGALCAYGACFWKDLGLGHLVYTTLLLCEWMHCGLVGLQSERPQFISVSITYSLHSLALSGSRGVHVLICKMGIKTTTRRISMRTRDHGCKEPST